MEIEIHRLIWFITYKNYNREEENNSQESGPFIGVQF